jgi:hypothetical protein
VFDFTVGVVELSSRVQLNGGLCVNFVGFVQLSAGPQTVFSARVVACQVLVVGLTAGKLCAFSLLFFRLMNSIVLRDLRSY